MTPNRAIIWSAILLSLVLTACAYYSLVEPGQRDIGGSYRAESQIAWSKSTRGQMEIWTVDGPSLEAIHFFLGIAQDQTLFPLYGKTEQKAKVPQFKKNMTANEVMEFVVDSMMAPGPRSPIGPNMKGVGVQTIHLRPFKFGGHPGFRFELSFLSEEGLEYEGMVAGTVKDDKLYIICYTGTREYYYPKYKDTVEQIIASIKMP